MTYNGYKNWNHWNVILWINNDESLYNLARSMVRRYQGVGGKRKAAAAFLSYAPASTPDGARYSISAVAAAMSDM